MTEYFNEMKREAGFDTKINEDTSLPQLEQMLQTLQTKQQNQDLANQFITKDKLRKKGARSIFAQKASTAKVRREGSKHGRNLAKHFQSARMIAESSHNK